MNNDVLDDELHDGALMSEIQLVADLMVAAGESAGSLDQRTIDELLGVSAPVTPDEEPR